jgi:hypothetical protein
VRLSAGSRGRALAQGPGAGRRLAACRALSPRPAVQGCAVPVVRLIDQSDQFNQFDQIDQFRVIDKIDFVQEHNQCRNANIVPLL